MFISEFSKRRVGFNLNNRFVRLTNFLTIGPVTNPIENDFFNLNLKNIFMYEKQKVAENEFIKLQDGSSHKVYYFDQIETFNDTCTRPSIDFTKIELMDNQRIFIFANVYSDKYKNVLFRIGRANDFKLWINDKLIHNKNSNINKGFVESIGFSDMLFINTSLQEGDNNIIIELNKNSKMISVKISDFSYELEGIEGAIIKEYYEMICKNKINVIHMTNICNDVSDYKFMVIPKDYINISIYDDINIKIKHEDTCLSNIQSKFYNRITLSLDNFRKHNIYVITIEITYKTNDGNQYSYDVKVLISNYDNLIKEITHKYDTNYNKLNIDDKLNISGRIDVISEDLPLQIQEIKPWVIENEIKNIYKIFYLAEYGGTFIEYVKKGGVYRLFYKSKIDDSTQSYCIFIPPNYSEKNSYSLVINLRAGTGTDFVMFHSMQPYKNVILAEISTRGSTQGSYIGEIAILEAIDSIKKMFNFDNSKISLIGYSTGAFAVWAMAQNYPYMFNSIALVSGFAYIPNLVNLSNTYILNISAINDDMVEKSYNDPTKVMNEINPRYHGVLLKNGDHLSITTALFSKFIIEKLIENNTYLSNNICFRTERIRHNTTHWIKIVNFSNSYAKVSGKFESNKFYLDLENIEEFIFNKQNFCSNLEYEIFIKEGHSNTRFLINNKDVIGFKKIEGRYHLCDKFEDLLFSSNSKGMGLLDIFMDGLRIVKPKTYESCSEEEVINKVVNCFGCINTISYVPLIDVKYPIINIEEFNENCLYDDNLIIVSVGTNKLLSIVKDLLPIKIEDNGFYYKEKFIKGDYSILFICNNPYYTNKRILIVYANNYELFNKNFFLKRFILPSYSSGIHPYLNSEALIYNGKKYSTIDIIGNDIIYNP